MPRERIVIRPPAVDGGDDFNVAETTDGARPGHRAWRVRGPKPERWVRQTDFSNDEAVGFLADRLNRLGVETRLVALGAIEGDTVLIGHPDNAVVFDFRPGIDAGVEMLGRRGEDQRFEESRPAASADANRRRDGRPGRGVRLAPTSPVDSTVGRLRDRLRRRSGPRRTQTRRAVEPVE